ncbi:hypothetical protein IIM_05222 [Bacillus cereus VD107]|uniref:ABC transporter permease n=1 Tax=Bacillus paramycoides TaxID=2026194 RepID=UPI00027A0E4E|nr:hypothetical protein IIM_05222 [Bacillus cereus VD107]
MVDTLRSEYLKLKRKKFFLTILVIQILEMFWVFAALSQKRMLQNWETLISNLSMLNGLFLSIMIAVIVSRLIDLEHKENTWKMLFSSPVSKISIYFGKLICVMILLIFSGIVSFIGIILISKVLNFSGSIPLLLIFKYIIFYIITSLPIVAFQLWISLMIKNQAFALGAGIAGSFLGYFGRMFSWNKLLFWTYPSSSSPIGYEFIENKMIYTQNTEVPLIISLSIVVGILLILISSIRFLKKDVD